MTCWEIEVSGFFPIFVNSDRVCANQRIVRMLFEESQLLFKPVFHGYVIAIHSGDEFSLGQIDTSVEAINDSLILFVSENFNSVVAASVFAKNGTQVILGAVVDNDEFKI